MLPFGASLAGKDSAEAASGLAGEVRVGEAFDAVITGVTPKATWLRVEPSGIEGRLVRGPEDGKGRLVACEMDGAVENIFWPTGSAPAGNYSVSVSYFSNCGGSDPAAFSLSGSEGTEAGEKS